MPIDLFKTQMQIQIIKSKTIKDYVPEFTTTTGCFLKVLKMNGILGAYQGIVPHLIRNGCAGAFYFGFFEETRLYYARKGNCSVKDISIMQTIIAGGMGGIGFWVLFYPLDVVKSAAQSDSTDKSKRKYN